VVGAAAWNLAELVELRRSGGLEAVAERLAQDTGNAGPDVPADERRIHLPTGYEMHPWADLQPAGDRAATGRKLWHSSPGSAG
jgi:error-prone DNA polymerase